MKRVRGTNRSSQSLLRFRLGTLLVCSLLALLALPALGQGRTDYMNVESPHVHPIEVARISGYDYLLVANTPDSSVEIYDTNEGLPPQSRLLARVRVGQEPVSVRYNPATRRFYTANFLGDSISIVIIAAPGGPTTLSVNLERTTLVGDEPMDVSFFDNAGTPTLFVTHMSLDGFGWRDAVSLAPVVPGVTERLDASVVMGPTTFGLKEPRTTLVTAQGVYILGGKGGNTPQYDFDLFVFDLATSTFRALGGVATTNFNMVAARNGDLFVVGQDALNRVLAPEPAVAAACTGFAPSTLSWVQNPSTATPVVLTRDLNALPGAACNPVAKPVALTQPTDVALLETDAGVRKVFLSALSSDRIGVIVPNSATPINWPRRTINVAPIQPSSTKAGPVGLAIKGANPAVSTDPGARLYVLNRFDHSVTLIDPIGETVVGAIALSLDPRPAYILAGQHFLYDAEQSLNGFSACSSCHPYGRTDGLAWDLGSPGQPQSPFNLNFSDGQVEFAGNPPVIVFNQLIDNLNNGFSDRKGLMVTQSLQGLLNFEVGMAERGFTTNAPYYWRGTRFDFPDFNGGFQNLLLGPGLTAAEMAAYHEFINSIHYPPNPQQLKNRVLSGVVGGTGGTSTLGQSGLEMYHTRPLCVTPACVPELEANRSCVHCHALPEGSNNRATEFLPNLELFAGGTDLIALETAALRGLFQKEARLDRSGLAISPVVTGFEGLAHQGGAVSINGFNLVFGAFF
ncbi:MAG: hypothetical protein KDD47_23475, partial [Acidobacteria bacterium]|nr:hypothetical protein [Acidobacteriota bacterium]